MAAYAQIWRPPAPPALLLLAYFGMQVVARMLHPGALELDEAEQALWTQSLAAGYGPQPPLYTWLQWTLFRVLGPSVLALALLKNTLLAATYAFVFLTARRLVLPNLALLAAGSMLLIPSIGWASQRDLTHTVLVTCTAAATLYVVVRLMERRTPDLYVALGVALGLGVLGKYNFAVFALVLAIALATGRSTRPVLSSPWILLSLVVAAVLVAPHALWLVDNWHLAHAHAAGKLGLGGGGLAGRLEGLLGIVRAVAEFAVVPALMLTLTFGWGWWQAPRGDREIEAFWVRYLIATAAVLGGLVVFGGATEFRNRWLQPLLFLLPLIVFTTWTGLVSSPRLPRLRLVLAAVASLYIGMAASRPVLDGWRGRPDELNAPIDQLADALRGAGYDGRAPILTDVAVLGGSLRLHFPQATVTFLKNGAVPAAIAGPHLLIRTGQREGEVHARAGAVSQHALLLPYRYAHPGEAEAAYSFDLQP